MKLLYCFILFPLCCLAESTLGNNIQKLYVFEDSPLRMITVRFENDSTVTISNRENENNGWKRILFFSDTYRYNWISHRKIGLYLSTTNRDDYTVRKKPILPARMNTSQKVNYSCQIFPLLSDGVITFSEDYSLLSAANFILRSTDSLKWMSKTNLVSPLLYARLEIGKFKKYLYKFGDRKERNLTFHFVDSKTVEIENRDLSGKGLSFIDRYEVKPYKKKLCRYKIVKLLSTTRSDRRKASCLPPMSSGEMSCSSNVLPILEGKCIYFNISYLLLQIGQFSFNYVGDTVPLG